MTGTLLLRFSMTISCCLSSVFLAAQLNADFNFSATEGCGSVQVSFCDESTSSNNIVAWSWDLGGVASSQECPGRIFGSSGTHTVCLTVTDAQGNTDTECKVDLITVFEEPTADFNSDFTQGCAPLAVDFLDMSTAPQGSLVEWEWILEGPCGTVVLNDMTNSNTNCIFTDPGSYDVSLRIIDENGCSDYISKPDYITIHPDPIISFTTLDTFSCTAPLSAQFLNENIELGVLYTWDFGNGDTYEGPIPPIVSYNSIGNYDVELKAENTSTTCEVSEIKEDLIQIAYPVTFTADAQTVCVGETLRVEDTSVDAADSIRWTFSDGSFFTSNSVDKTFDFPGCYTFTLNRYIDGCVFTEVGANCILVNPAPSVSYSNDNNIGCTLPHVVNFVGMSSTAQTWSWDFGDGSSPENTQYPVHQFNQYGDFEVELTVTNAQGCSNSEIINTIEVKEVEAQIDEIQIAGCLPLDANFTENSYSVTPINTWNWEVVTDQGAYQSNTDTGMFSIPDTGVWDLILTVSNTLGCVDVDTLQRAIVVGTLPEIAFEADPREECIETDINFTDLSSNYAESWVWEFGDGDIATTQNATHQYQDTGYYDIILTASHNGCENDTVYQDYIHIKEPLSKFNISLDCEQPYLRFFNDQSIGAQTVLWDFGVTESTVDTSTAWNPTFVYPNTGTYIVTQTVFNSSTSCDHSTTKTVVITEPNANFDLNVFSGCVPLEIQTVDLSDFAVEWDWTSPGGSLSNNQFPEPNITFNSAGAYTDIELIIKDFNNCRDTFLLVDTIFVNGITVDFSFDPASGCNPLPVNFIDSSSNLFANNIQWDWDFGDGTASESGLFLDHAFNEQGLFDITLTVRDDWGCSETLSIPDAIDVAQPVADFSTLDTLSCTSHCVQFQNSSIGNDLNYYWDFGDGNISIDENPEHCYQTEGLYDVCLTIEDNYGCDSTLCKLNYIEIADPVANFTGSPLSASCPPLESTFVNLSQNATSFFWTFESNTDTSFSENPIYIYEEPGLFSVSLVAASTDFCRDTLTIDNYIDIDGPKGDFSFEIDTSCTPVKVTFKASSAEPYEYIWHFGNGETLARGAGLSSDSLIYFYETPGTFLSSLQLIDPFGCSRIIEAEQTIYISQLIAQFVASDTLLCDENNPIIFSNLSNSTDPILFSEWLFEGGDIPQTNDLEPSIIYNLPGEFDVQLIVANEFCIDTLSRNDFIKVGSLPNANFLKSAEEGCAPLQVDFTDLSSVPNSTIVSWEWDFGNGLFSNLQNPSNTYTSGGVFPISLKVTSDIGCQSVFSQTITVSEIAELNLSDDQTICIGGVASLSAEIVGDTSGLFYSWSPATDLSCTQCLNPNASPLDTTTYLFTVTNADGCITTSATKVNVLPFSAPVIEISKDTSICYGNFAQLNVVGGANVYEYQWDELNSGLSCYQNCNNPLANPLENTTYHVTVTNEYGCSSRDSVTIEVIDDRQSFATEDQIICEGNEIQLNIDYGEDPTWSNTTGLSCIYCPNPIANPTTSIHYVVEVRSQNNCLISDSVFIEVIDENSIDAGEDVKICEGETIQLAGKGSGNVSWFPREYLDNTMILTPNANPLTTTQYFLETTLGQCVLRDSVWIEVNTKTMVEAEDLEICKGDSINLFLEGEFDVVNWYVNSIFLTDNESPFLVPEEDLAISAIAKWRTCIPDTVSFLITSNELPQVELPTVHEFLPEQGIQIELDYDESESYDFTWFPNADLDCNKCPRPIVQTDSSFLLTLIVEDLQTKCENEFSSFIQPANRCPENLIAVPNAFSPNEDGQNDELEIFPSPAIKEYVSDFRVVDRWGNVVFQTNNPDQNWSGNYKSKPAPIGIYLCEVRYLCPITGRLESVFSDVLLIK